MTPAEKLIEQHATTQNPKPEGLKEGELWATHSGVWKCGDTELRVHRLSNGVSVIDADDFNRVFGEMLDVVKDL